AIEPRFLRSAVLAQEVVVGLPNLRARRPRLEHIERGAPRLQRERQLFFHLLRGLADDGGATELGVKAPRSIVLDQQGEVVALANDAVLRMAMPEFAGSAERSRRAQINPLLAAMTLAEELCGGRDVAVAHARLDGIERSLHGAVLHQRRAAHELHLLRALDA